MPAVPRLTPEQARVLYAIGDGADVWGYAEALVVRAVAHEHPGLVRIVHAKAIRPGHMQQPYFGAKLTKRGKRILEAN